jgi:hypothetical protein
LIVGEEPMGSRGGTRGHEQAYDINQ